MAPICIIIPPPLGISVWNYHRTYVQVRYFVLIGWSSKYRVSPSISPAKFGCKESSCLGTLWYSCYLYFCSSINHLKNEIPTSNFQEFGYQKTEVKCLTLTENFILFSPRLVLIASLIQVPSEMSYFARLGALRSKRPLGSFRIRWMRMVILLGFY